MENIQETAVQTETDAPVTDSANTVDNSAEKQSDNKPTSSVEHKDGKLFVDGVRVYTRDDTNKIAANAKREVENSLITELNVDSIDAVKGVVKTLQESTPTEEGSSLNVNSLRDAVKKREATVEELQQQQVKSLKTDLLLKDHMGQLNSAMPGNWNADQKTAVVDLMKARNMLAVEGDTFAIRSGESYLTIDGETPDYAGAVEIVGKTLGLNFGKQGVDLQYGESTTDSSKSNKGLDDGRVVSDAEYRSAYLDLRNYQKLERDNITDSMVKKQMSKRRSSV